jgi:hypothetical protein
MAAFYGWVTATTSATLSYDIIAAQMVVYGLGMGLTSAPATESIMGAISAARAGVGSAVNDSTRLAGGTLGVAVIGSVYASVYGSRLTATLPPSPPSRPSSPTWPTRRRIRPMRPKAPRDQGPSARRLGRAGNPAPDVVMMSLGKWERQALGSIEDGLAGSDPTWHTRMTSSAGHGGPGRSTHAR